MWKAFMRKLIWLPILAMNFFLSTNLVAGKRNIQTGLPYTDRELLDIIMKKDDVSDSRTSLFHDIGFQEAAELFFEDLGGVADIVLSAYDNHFRLIVFNHPDKLNLNEIKGTYSIRIHPFYRGAPMKEHFVRHKVRANREGIIDEVIAVNDFYNTGVVHYAVILSYNREVRAPVEIRRFHLVMAAIPVHLSREFLVAQMKDDRSLAAMGLPSVKEEQWKGEKSLKDHITRMPENVLVLDMSELHGAPMGLLPKAAFHFLQENSFEAESAGLCLVVVPEAQEVARGQLPDSCILTSTSRYQTVFKQLVLGLQNDSWKVVQKRYAEFTDIPDLDALYPDFVFSKLYLEGNAVRHYAPSLFVEAQQDEYIQFSLGNRAHFQQAQLYVTPAIMNQGFHFASGEYTKVRVSKGRFSLPFLIKNMPIPSWHYLVDIRLSSAQKAENVRCSLVVLNPQNIDHVCVVQFAASSNLSPKGALAQRANTVLVCEPDKYCPLVVIHPAGSQALREFLPSDAIFLTEEDAAALPHNTFANMSGELWYETLPPIECPALALFAKKPVSSGAVVRLGRGVKPVLPSASDDDGIDL